MSLEELVAKTESQLKLLREQINRKKAELDEIRARDEMEKKHLEKTVQELRAEIEERRKFIAQRKRDFEASGLPAYDPSTEKKPQLTVSTAVCTFPSGSNISIEYGDYPRDAFATFTTSVK